MGIKGRQTLKRWFRRGAYPSESQFADWIDSFIHRSEDRIGLDDVEGLTQSLNSKFDRSSGVAYGQRIATLEENRMTDSMQLDSLGKRVAFIEGETGSVAEFSGRVSGITVKAASVGQSSADDGCEVVYNTDSRRFVMAVRSSSQSGVGLEPDYYNN